MSYRVEGNIVDIEQRRIFEGSICVDASIIKDIREHQTSIKSYIIPGFIDSHVHIESSMLTPANFGKLVVAHGTTAVVNDPHEIANVMGVSGVEFMIENSYDSPIKNFFTIPSCVPATEFDVTGGCISAQDVEWFANSGRFVALSEMMNVPGIINRDEQVMAKIDIANKFGLPVDGHAPLLGGKELKQYIENGLITTDHECIKIEEALLKIDAGVKILIREGSAAKNYEALKSLIQTAPNMVMFCTDDSHPDHIIELGHIDKLVRKAVSDGFDIFDTLRIACLNPVEHYKLDVGTLKIGDKADFIVIDSLDKFDTEKVYINGVKQFDKYAEQVVVITPNKQIEYINNFNLERISTSALQKSVSDDLDIISLVPNEIITTKYRYKINKTSDNFESETNDDILKLIYINRYNNGTPQIAYCKGFNLKHGAIASSIAHDSHNIIAVGCSDNDLAQAINAIIDNKGGISVCQSETTSILKLPIGGIMSDRNGRDVAQKYRQLCTLTHQMGCGLDSPFMSLAFLSLVVIPEIRIGEKGLFCFDTFSFST